MPDGRLALGMLLAFGLTLGLVRLLGPLARRVGLVDRPTRRKVHGTPTPLVGGLAIWLASLAGLLLLDMALDPVLALLLGGAVLVAVGVLDDFQELSSRVRFAVQIAVGLLACLWGDVRLVDMGLLRLDGSATVLGAYEVPLTVFCIVGVINALNMSDGLDGLASGLAAVALGAMCWVAWTAGQVVEGQVLAVVLVAVVAFWGVNTRAPGRAAAPAFLGDAGSLFLGFVISWFVVVLSQGEARAVAPVQALWCVALPLFDTVRLMVWRAATGGSPFAGDQEHLHHVLRRLGFGHGQTVALMLATAVVLAVLGLGLPALGVSELQMFLIFMSAFCLYSLALGIICWRGGVLGRVLESRVGPADRRQASDRSTGERRPERRRACQERRARD